MSIVLRRRELLRVVPASALYALGCGTTDAPAAATSVTKTPEARLVSAVVAGRKSKDGAGVRLSRIIGGGSLTNLDPFLLLDEIKSDVPTDYIHGFPMHPHRGFETVTIMLDGAFEHRDSVGNHGRLVGGSVQWMTAGRGIVHSEMPGQTSGLLWGLQLWVNLPKRLKMTAPRYQDVAPTDIPEVSESGAAMRVATGATSGAKGPIEGISGTPTLLDVRVESGSELVHEVPPNQTVFAYVLDGALEIGGDRKLARRGEIAVLGPGASVVARPSGGPGRLLLAAADPIGEPIARRGPFVMNTEAELDQAFDDYRNGRLTDG